jgi:hypothetical protein
MTRVKRAGVVSKVVEHVPSKHEVLSLNPKTTKKKKKKTLKYKRVITRLLKRFGEKSIEMLTKLPTIYQQMKPHIVLKCEALVLVSFYINTFDEIVKHSSFLCSF